MLRCSIDKGQPIKASTVVLYEDDIPIGVFMDHGGPVYFVDSIRDRAEFITVLTNLGIPLNRLHDKAAMIQGGF